METKETMTLLNKETQELETYNIHTGELVARSGELVSTKIYTLELGDAIAHLIREGLTYAKISKQIRVPLHLIYGWRDRHPDFAQKLKDARRDRGTYFHDKAVDCLEDNDTIEKEEVPGLKFKFDSYMKLAGISAPQEYAPAPKIAAVAAPATIIINTGISREPVTIDGESYDPTRETFTSGEEQAGRDQREGSDEEGSFREIREEEAGDDGTSSRGSGVEEESNKEEINEEKGE